MSVTSEQMCKREEERIIFFTASFYLLWCLRNVRSHSDIFYCDCGLLVTLTMLRQEALAVSHCGLLPLSRVIVPYLALIFHRFRKKERETSASVSHHQKSLAAAAYSTPKLWPPSLAARSCPVDTPALEQFQPDIGLMVRSSCSLVRALGFGCFDLVYMFKLQQLSRKSIGRYITPHII